MEEDKKIIAIRAKGLKTIAIVMWVLAAFSLLLIILVSDDTTRNNVPNAFLSMTLSFFIVAIVFTVSYSITPQVLADYSDGKINLYPIKGEIISVSPQDIESVNIGRYNRDYDVAFSRSGNVYINLKTKKNTFIGPNGETRMSIDPETVTLRWVADMERSKRLLEALRQGKKPDVNDFITVTAFETNINNDSVQISAETNVT